MNRISLVTLNSLYGEIRNAKTVKAKERAYKKWLAEEVRVRNEFGYWGEKDEVYQTLFESKSQYRKRLLKMRGALGKNIDGLEEIINSGNFESDLEKQTIFAQYNATCKFKSHVMAALVNCLVQKEYLSV